MADDSRVVSNFGDGDCGAGEIHTHARAREISRRRDAEGAPPQSPSPKLETTRSLKIFREFIRI